MKIKKSYSNIVITDVYSLDELLSNIPFAAQDVMHIKVETYGFVHDVGIRIELKQILNGENPTGWETLKQDFIKTVQHCQDMWQIANNFAYH